MTYRPLFVSVLLALGAAHSMAQTAPVAAPVIPPVTTTASTVQRDVNQQTRIENGLKDGSLSTKEAGKLEKEESHVDRLQAKDLRDGKLSPAERAQLRRAQNKTSRDIQSAETNNVKGNPDSKSSERMQADVQRNVNQEKRVERGVQSGSLTNHEVGKLEGGQARVDRTEARAAADGHVGKLEQASIQHKEDRQSGKIFLKKHNGVERRG